MTVDTTKPQWYVLYTFPHHEAKVREELEHRDIATFLPMRKEIRFWSDRKRNIMVPLFSNYLFVNIGRKHRAQALKPAGVIRFLDSNANPSVVPDKDIDIIKKILNGNVDTVIDDDIMPGDDVVITSGPLSGLRGPLVTRKGGDRMLVKVGSIKKEVLVDISGHCVERVPGSTAN
jgi:transcription antitermination factor NusG